MYVAHNILPWLKKYYCKNDITRFVCSFTVLFSAMAFINHAFISLTTEGGYYNAWVAKYLDYVSLYRSVLLKSAGAVTGLFGYDYRVDMYHLYINNNSGVRMVYSCIGLNILSFWAAFTLSFPNTRTSKLKYCLSGLIAISLLNVMRIATLAMVRTLHDFKHSQFDHHLIFNIVVYLFIFGSIVHMINNSTAKKIQVEASCI